MAALIFTFFLRIDNLSPVTPISERTSAILLGLMPQFGATFRSHLL